MRENGVTHLSVRCECGYSADVDMKDYPAHLRVPDFNGRFKCRCGSKKTRVQPAWHKRTGRHAAPPHPGAG